MKWFSSLWGVGPPNTFYQVLLQSPVESHKEIISLCANLIVLPDWADD